VLSRFGFDFARGGHVRHQRQVHKQGMLTADLYRHLTNGFKELAGIRYRLRYRRFHQYDVSGSPLASTRSLIARVMRIT
jgi:hypothetical protein